jgi:hypothetical protein
MNPAIQSIDWEKEDREAREGIDWELVQQEDRLSHGTESPLYPTEIPDHEYNY